MAYFSYGGRFVFKRSLCDYLTPVVWVAGSTPVLAFLVAVAIFFGLLKFLISSNFSIFANSKEVPMVKNALMSFFELIQNFAIGLLVSAVGAPQV